MLTLHRQVGSDTTLWGSIPAGLHSGRVEINDADPDGGTTAWVPTRKKTDIGQVGRIAGFKSRPAIIQDIKSE